MNGVLSLARAGFNCVVEGEGCLNRQGDPDGAIDKSACPRASVDRYLIAGNLSAEQSD
jgi:hypothetical protein